MANGAGGWGGDNDDPSGLWDISGQWNLTAGLHAIEFRMHEFTGGESNVLHWDIPDDGLGWLVVETPLTSSIWMNGWCRPMSTTPRSATCCP